MSQASNPARRILAVGAHPDDIEFACGGILLAEKVKGTEVFLCVCSRGEAGSNGTPDEREGEARAAAKLLGAEIAFLDFGGDSNMEASNRNALALACQIRLVKPAILLSPVTSLAQHPDHRVVGMLCRDAARFARYAGIAELSELAPHALAHHLEYAVTPGAEPRDRLSVRVDIRAHYAKWIELMECHQTQLRTRSYVDLQTARARLLGVEAGVEYAQALFPTNDSLVTTLAEIPPSVRLF